MNRQAMIPSQYGLIDLRTGQVVKYYASQIGADRKADRLNMQDNAVHYTVRKTPAITVVLAA